MTAPKRRSRYDVSDEPPKTDAAAAPNVPGPWDTGGEAAEARRLLESARADIERLVMGEMRRLEATLSAKAERVAMKLHETRAQIERLESETAAMRAKPYDDLLKQLRQRMDSV